MTVAPTVTPYQCAQGFTAPAFGYTLQWVGMSNGSVGDSGSATQPGQTLIPWLDRTFQVEGTFGAGGTVNIEGTNDGTNWRTLTNPQGVSMVFTSPGILQVVEVTLQMRPRVAAGDGTTNITVTAFYRREDNGL